MILNSSIVEVNTLPEGTDLVGELRRFNERDHDQAYGWIIQTEVKTDDEYTYPQIMVALHRDKGAIYYASGGQLRVPKTGSGTGLLYVYVGRESAKPKRTVPGSEVDAETVYKAVGEFLEAPEPPPSLKWIVPTFVAR